jgi:ketosteroid isomerase-like protein
MSQENVELVRQVYEGWSRGDFSRVEAFDPEIEFEMVDWPHQTRVRGFEEMWRTWRATLSAWDDFRAVPLDYVDCGQNVLVINHIQGSGKESGAEVSAQTATVWTIEGGRVVRLALYWDVVRAREAAGTNDEH